MEACSAISLAEKVLYLAADPLSTAWLRRQNSSAESLSRFYKPGKDRRAIYSDIVEEILRWLRRRINLCVVFYGHPGFLVYPGHEAIRRARLEGFNAEMLPGVSAEDRLFVDLGVDPGFSGCQSYEATSFLLYKYRFDPRGALILYQIGVLGESRWKATLSSKKLRVLVDYLLQFYRPEHEVVCYEACFYPVGKPTIERMRLSELSTHNVTALATLYIPPAEGRMPDRRMHRRLSGRTATWTAQR